MAAPGPTVRSPTAPQAVLPGGGEGDSEVPIARRFVGYLRGRCPVPISSFDQALWGLSQPVIGARLLLAHSSLIALALGPVLVTSAICIALAYADFEGSGFLGLVRSLYLVLVAAAPISPIFFTRTYSRMAARARSLAGYGERQPYLRSFGAALREAILQLIVIGIGLAPVTFVFGLVPVAGWLWGGGVTLVWALHWIAVEALDSARTGVADEQAHADPGFRPWFVRIFDLRPEGPLEPLFAPARWWGSVLHKMTRHWHDEVEFLEKHPFVGLGFAAGAALVLAIPVFNLLFRPIVVIAAVVLQAQIELAKTAEPTESSA